MLRAERIDVQLYLRYEELTLEKFAALNGIALGLLLRLLNAPAEDEDRCQRAKTRTREGRRLETSATPEAIRESDAMLNSPRSSKSRRLGPEYEDGGEQGKDQASIRGPPRRGWQTRSR
jgi:hypothetical protein